MTSIRIEKHALEGHFDVGRGRGSQRRGHRARERPFGRASRRLRQRIELEARIAELETERCLRSPFRQHARALEPAQVADLRQQGAAFVEGVGFAGLAGPRRAQDALEVAVDVACDAEGGDDVPRGVAHRRLDPRERSRPEERLRRHEARIGGERADELRAAREHLRELRCQDPRLRLGAAAFGDRRRDDETLAIDGIGRRGALRLHHCGDAGTPLRDLFACAVLRDAARVRESREVCRERGHLRVARPALAVGTALGDEHLEGFGLGLEQRRQALSAELAQRALYAHVHPQRDDRQHRAKRENDQALPPAAGDEAASQA